MVCALMLVVGLGLPLVPPVILLLMELRLAEFTGVRDDVLLQLDIPQTIFFSPNTKVFISNLQSFIVSGLVDGVVEVAVAAAVGV